MANSTEPKNEKGTEITVVKNKKTHRRWGPILKQKL